MDTRPDGEEPDEFFELTPEDFSIMQRAAAEKRRVRDHDSDAVQLRFSCSVRFACWTPPAMHMHVQRSSELGDAC